MRTGTGKPGSQARDSVIREKSIREDYRALYGEDPPEDFIERFGDELYKELVRDGSMKTWSELTHEDLVEAGLM